MVAPINITTRIKTVQDASACAHCPPDRVCAWACVQGTGISDIITGAALLFDGRLNDPIPPADPGAEAAELALWESFNVMG
ncbi:MAG: hypothetical protein Kow00124_08830 [Anaerolineae bacterium]